MKCWVVFRVAMKYWVAFRVALRVGFAIYCEACAHRGELEWVVKAAKNRFAEIVTNIMKEIGKK